MAGIRRRFVYVVFASTLMFLVYLLLTTSSHVSSPDPPREAKEIINAPNFGALHASKAAGHAPPSTPSKIIQAIRPAGEAEKNTKEDTGQIRDKNEIAEKLKSETNGPLQIRTSTTRKQILKPVSAPGATWPTIDENDPYSGPRNDAQRQVVGAFMHAWVEYKKYAWGHDELKPVSNGWQEWMGLGLTIVDSLDTMFIMGLKTEFAEARDWVAKNLSFDKDRDVQLFEIVIRELGGLLSAYYFTNDNMFLQKAIELGDKLSPCFKGTTKIPCNRINLSRGRPNFIEISTAETGTIQLEFRALSRAAKDPKHETELGNKLEPCLKNAESPVPCRMMNMNRSWPRFEDISTAEAGSVQLEFRGLARAGNLSKFEVAMEGISQHLHNLPKLDGLVACFLNPHTGTFRQTSTVSVGASADSYYEYLLKQWIQTGKTKTWLRDDYLEAVAGIRKHLYRFSEPSKLGFVGALHSMTSRSFRSEMEHLACFLPGALALGYIHGLGDESHLKMARNLTYSCYEMYRRMPTGLSPEVALFNTNIKEKEDIAVGFGAAFNLQRPETVESIFYMYRATKDPIYREWGMKIFEAFEKHTKLKDGGYSSIENVRRPDNPGHRDKMETFYLAETLKYLYLLFSDDPNLIPLDKFVINTEAHPLPVYAS